MSLSASDDVAGVRELHVRVEPEGAQVNDYAFIDAGAEFTLPPLTAEGGYIVTYFAVDAVGNAEPPQTVRIRIDRTPPSVSGLPPEPCVLWPPNHRLVRVADIVGADALSGVADLVIDATSNEPGHHDIVIWNGTVWLRAERNGWGTGRIYSLVATVTDRAGNAASESTECSVPRKRQR